MFSEALDKSEGLSLGLRFLYAFYLNSNPVRRICTYRWPGSERWENHDSNPIFSTDLDGGPESCFQNEKHPP